MERIEKNDLFVCSLKEMLKDFNLPMIAVYTDECIPRAGKLYIKDNWIVKYIDGEFVRLSEFTYNRKSLNLTKNFIIKSSVYDEYTHNYLGDYLRFQRDYNNHNLMGMYNCFFNQKPGRIYYNTTWKFERDGIVRDASFNLDTDNDKFNYYAVPIKFDQTYTIAIDSQTSYEIACILYNNMFIDDMPDQLVHESYKSISGSSYRRPFIYDTHFKSADTLWPREKSLKLLIKIPKMVTSSITVLEGDFTQDAQVLNNVFMPEVIYNEEKLPTRYISKSSLLAVNNRESYPIADRLLEFVLGNVIDDQDWINQNVERVDNLLKVYDVKGLWTDKLRFKVYNSTYKEDPSKSNGTRFIDNNYDLTGYVDKDTEHFLEVMYG